MKRILLAVVLLLVGCGSAPQPTPLSIPLASSPRSVIMDTDMGPDDVLALLYLLSRPDVHLKAITISGTGVTRCTAGIRNVRAIVETLAHAEIPIACGRETPLQGTHAFPGEWRDAADNFFGLDLKSPNIHPQEENAIDLLARTLDTSDEKITMLALGPLTNLADALGQNRTLTRKLEMIYSMGGAVNVAGNVEHYPASEWNFYIDPVAAQNVIASGVPFTLVPLDATNRVPITHAFVERIHAQQNSRAAQLARRLLDTQSGEIENGTLYFWDPLAAAILTDNKLATFEAKKIAVATSDDVDSGRIALTEDGAAVRVAVDADAARYEQTFLQTLNGQFK